MAHSFLGRRMMRMVKTRRGISNTPTSLAEMNDSMEHATGIEKRELLAEAAGNKDPFMLSTVLKRGPGTKDEPNQIPSAFDRRLVGCVCHPEQRFVCWMWLEKDCLKRCECGYWFELKPMKPI